LKIDIPEKGTVYTDVLNRKAAPESYVVGVDLGTKQEKEKDELLQQSLCRRKKIYDANKDSKRTGKKRSGSSVLMPASGFHAINLDC
jgi:hypothetical protein